MATEACPYCSVVDALGRHAGDCQHAIEIGLPRLADGEEPIEGELGAQGLVNNESIEALGPTGPHMHPQWRGETDPRIAQSVQSEPDVPALWMTYSENDAVIFASEIEALRYAVREGHKVVPLELGKPLRDQTGESK